MDALSGRTILVVGATAGIGRALSERALGAVAADVADPQACAGLARAVSEAVGCPDAVIDCAGSATLRRLSELRRQDWDAVLGSGPVGANNLISALAPGLKAGTVLAFLSSDSAAISPYALGAYAAAKAALEASSTAGGPRGRTCASAPWPWDRPIPRDLAPRQPRPVGGAPAGPQPGGAGGGTGP